MRRRLLLLPLLAAPLAACGFRLRGAPRFPFESLHLGATSALAQELRRNLESSGQVRVLDARALPTQAHEVLELLNEQRQKVVAGRSASGQVREFQLRMSLRFRFRTSRGVELIPETTLTQQRDISYNESQALAKEAEEELLMRDMQSDLVQQLMRRLAAVNLPA